MASEDRVAGEIVGTSDEGGGRGTGGGLGELEEEEVMGEGSAFGVYRRIKVTPSSGEVLEDGIRALALVWLLR